MNEGSGHFLDTIFMVVAKHHTTVIIHLHNSCGEYIHSLSTQKGAKAGSVSIPHFPGQVQGAGLQLLFTLRCHSHSPWTVVQNKCSQHLLKQIP